MKTAFLISIICISLLSSAISQEPMNFGTCLSKAPRLEAFFIDGCGGDHCRKDQNAVTDGALVFKKRKKFLIIFKREKPPYPTM